MKKTLYSTTALAAAGLLTLGAGDAFAQAAAPAAPEKLKIAVGGFMSQYVGWADNDNDWQGANPGVGRLKHFDQKSDSEIYFTGSVKMDNGITVAVNVQLEADVSSGGAGLQLDESFLTLTGDFGEVRLGATDAATFNLNIAAPNVGLSNCNGDQTAWIAATAGNQAGTGCGTYPGQDTNRIYYVTPALAGFRLGGSYSPDTTAGSLETQPTVVTSDSWDTILQFSDKFGDFAVRASAAYWRHSGTIGSATAAAATGATENWSTGADVTFADFTVGGAFGKAKPLDTPTAATTTQTAVTAWNLGARYNPGPFSVGLVYQHGMGEDTVAIAQSDEVGRWNLGATYILGPGVTAIGNVLRHSYSSEANDQANEKTGYAVVTGIKVDF